jgi:hypothetical protein
MRSGRMPASAAAKDSGIAHPILVEALAEGRLDGKGRAG